MFEEFIATRISQLREHKGVSARDMSLSIGQNANYINHIENRRTLPSMPAFLFICDYLGITPSEFFNEEISNPCLHKELIRELAGLNPNVLQLLLGLIREIKRM